MPARQPAPSALSLTGRLLRRVGRVCCARPALTVSLGVALAVLGAGYAAHSLTLETSKFHLLPLHQRYASLYKTHAEDFAQLEDIVVVVQSPAVETSTAYAARLAGALRDGGLGTARISYRIDASRRPDPAPPAFRLPAHVACRHHRASASVSRATTASTVISRMQTRPIGQRWRKHGAQGAAPVTASASQPKGVERAGLVAPQSETAGVPSAAARCSAPESGPKAIRARARMASSWRSVVRPARSRTPPSVSRSTAVAKGASAALPTSSALAPWRARSSRRTAAVRPGNQRREGQDEPRHAATSGPSRPAVSASASSASAGAGESPN